MKTSNLQSVFKKAVLKLDFTQNGLNDDGIPVYHSYGTVCKQYANVYLDHDSTIRLSTQGGQSVRFHLSN